MAIYSGEGTNNVMLNNAKFNIEKRKLDQHVETLKLFAKQMESKPLNPTIFRNLKRIMKIMVNQVNNKNQPHQQKPQQKHIIHFWILPL